MKCLLIIAQHSVSEGVSEPHINSRARLSSDSSGRFTRNILLSEL
jgi:hypothetical protein